VSTKSPPVTKHPFELGYHMPAEWEKHDAVWLAWPHDPLTFPSRVKSVEETYTRMVKLLSESETVNLFVKNQSMKHKVIHMFREAQINLETVRFFVFSYADVWFRDYGPTFLLNQQRELAMVHWVFNAWGEKYDTLLKDRVIPDVINQEMQLKLFEPGIVLEGGSIDVNGKGTVLTTEQCLLNKNRNPQLSKSEIESYLKGYLGASNVVWLKNGIEGDDTNGHVDDIARFVNPNTIVCAYEDDTADENHAILKENHDLLQSAKDQEGKKFSVVKLPMPDPVCDDEEKRLPASYANFYIGNKVVLAPVFGHKTDELALSILRRQFPDRKVAGINSVDLVYGLGSIHCVTQQQPSGKPQQIL
jgi:agmatine deiminase